MLYDILLVLSLLYALSAIVVACAAINSHYSYDRANRPRVSIIIAARNEQANIGSCLDAMAALSYPPNLLEVIIVDDRSTDGTHAIVDTYVRRYPHFRQVVATPGSGNLRGKTNAVTQGIDVATGDILLMTDADCLVPSGWIEETVKYFADKDVGIVAGFTLLEGNGWFSGIQAIDWLTLFSVAAAAIRMGIPITAVGTNLSVRRSAYDQVGSYRGIPFSVTEDYALFHAVTTQTPFKARFPLDATTLVISRPCRNLAELSRQRKRWFAGGRGLDLKYLLAFTVPYFLSLLLIVLPFVSLQPMYWIALALKVGADLLLAVPALTTFKRLSLLRYFLFFELYFLLYVIIHPIAVLFGPTVVWKERSFEH